MSGEGEEASSTGGGEEIDKPDGGAAAVEETVTEAATSGEAAKVETEIQQRESVAADASSSSTATPPATPSPAKSAGGSSKIDVLLKPAGNAPILKKKKWTVDRHKQVGWICDFIRKLIRTETEDSVFVYVNQSFSPSPDTEMGTLFDCFGSDGKLVIYYCRTQAWG